MRFTKAAVLAGIIIISMSYIGLGYLGAKAAAPMVSQMVVQCRDIAEIQYKKISYSPLTQKTSLHDVKISAAHGEPVLIKIAKFSFNIKKQGQDIISIDGNIDDASLESAINKDSISVGYDYRYDVADKSALIKIDASGEQWGRANVKVALAHFVPTIDLLFDYPSIQIDHGLAELHNKDLVDFTLNALGKNTTTLATDALYLSFNPQRPLKIAELADGFPSNLLANEAFKMQTKSEPFSLIGWIEGYLGRVKQEILS